MSWITFPLSPLFFVSFFLLISSFFYSSPCHFSDIFPIDIMSISKRGSKLQIYVWEQRGIGENGIARHLGKENSPSPLLTHIQNLPCVLIQNFHYYRSQTIFIKITGYNFLPGALLFYLYFTLPPPFLQTRFIRTRTRGDKDSRCRSQKEPRFIWEEEAIKVSDPSSLSKIEKWRDENIIY